MLSQGTLPGFDDAISSAALGDGSSRSLSPDGETPKCGPALVPARHSVVPEKRKPVRSAVQRVLCHALDELATSYAQLAATHGLPMSATFGRSSGASSPSHVLQSSLVSKCLERMDCSGSLEYALRWKSSATVLGPPICALRASGRQISGNGFSGRQSARTSELLTGWPSPKVEDTSNESIETKKARNERHIAAGNTKGVGSMTLPMVATLTGWPSPNTPNGGRSTSTEAMDATGKTADGRKHTASLEHAVKFAPLAGWTTPQANEPNTEERPSREETGRTTEYLGRQVQGALAGWATPVADPANGTPERFLERKREAIENGSTMGVCLSDLQMQAIAWTPSGWATPAHRDYRYPNLESYQERSESTKGEQLNNQVVHHGPSSHAATGSYAASALNPAMSRWLMSFPKTWDRSSPNWSEWESVQTALSELSRRPERTEPEGCADTETPLTQNSPPCLFDA